jgi:hypothetical protein
MEAPAGAEHGRLADKRETARGRKRVQMKGDVFHAISVYLRSSAVPISLRGV